jgi:hypothetical protein
MKNLLKSFGLCALAGTICSTALADTKTSRARIVTDSRTVLTAPNLIPAQNQTQIKLVPGVYAISRPGKLFAERLMFIENYQNKPNAFLAIQIDRRNLDAGKSSTGRLFIGSIIERGTAVKLSPLILDQHTGMPINLAKISTQARISKITDTGGDERHRYPYTLQGINGAQGGELWSMRRIEDSRYSLVLKPNATLFSFGGRGSNLVVNGSQVILNIPGQKQKLEFAAELGTGQGALSFMNPGKYNAMTDKVNTESRIDKFAFVLNVSCDRSAYGSGSRGDGSSAISYGGNFWDEQFFVTVSPTNGTEDFQFDFYGKKRRSLWDILFPGDR